MSATSHCGECYQVDGFHRDFCSFSNSYGQIPKKPLAQAGEPKAKIDLHRVPEDAVLSLDKDMEQISEHVNFRTFTVKDSGERQKFESGMQRDTQTGKADIARVFDGPMLYRWADHITKGAVKYPDVEPGKPNWMLASGQEELNRFKKSAARHFYQWMRGDTDEDHAAAVMFNINGAEYVKDKGIEREGK